MTQDNLTALQKQFLQGIALFQKGEYAGAEAAFGEVIAADPQGDLADDALYNLGLGYFQQQQFDRAEEAFRKLIDEYPESTIAEFENSVEHGKTPAKARLGLINCYLAMGRENEARALLDELAPLTDSWVMVPGPGGPVQKTFHRLAVELLDKYDQAKQEIAQQQAE